MIIASSPQRAATWVEAAGAMIITVTRVEAAGAAVGGALTDPRVLPVLPALRVACTVYRTCVGTVRSRMQVTPLMVMMSTVGKTDPNDAMGTVRGTLQKGAAATWRSLQPDIITVMAVDDEETKPPIKGFPRVLCPSNVREPQLRSLFERGINFPTFACLCVAAKPAVVGAQWRASTLNRTLQTVFILWATSLQVAGTPYVGALMMHGVQRAEKIGVRRPASPFAGDGSCHGTHVPCFLQPWRVRWPALNHRASASAATRTCASCVAHCRPDTQGRIPWHARGGDRADAVA